MYVLVRNALTAFDEDAMRTCARRAAALTFRALESLGSKRIANEDLGDAEEFVRTLDRRDWDVWVKTASTVFWVVVNSARPRHRARGG